MAAKIAERLVDRVRIVFSVRLWSSEATMSPATRAVTSGNRNRAEKSSVSSGTANPDSTAKRRKNGMPESVGLGGCSSIAAASSTGAAAAAPRPR